MGHVRLVVGLNPRFIYWIDIWTLISCKNVVCLQRPIINEKEAGVGQFKKVLTSGCLVGCASNPHLEVTSLYPVPADEV